MLVNKKRNMTPYDMARRPAKQYPILMPLLWAGSWVMTRQFGLKVDKSGLKGIKPPYLVIATHQGFSDYYIAPLAMFPRRAMYVSDMEGYAAFGNWLYRGLGCIPKRRFVADISVIRNIKYGLKKGQAVFVYPESRHSNVGTTAYISSEMARLCKMLKVPVVTLTANGSYLANPFWDEEHTRRVPMRAKMELLCDAERLATIDQQELQDLIENKLQYDEYRYQQDNNILIKDAKRAEGLHKALYKCRCCGVSNLMTSSGSSIKCGGCGTKWELTEDGWLVDDKTNSKTHIPDWYEWQRGYEIDNIDGLSEKYEVRVEALPNEYGFVDLGNGMLELDANEFVLTIDGKRMSFPHWIRESVQTEYNYRGKGMAIVLSTADCCYYIYSDDKRFQPTRLQFIGEYLYQQNR